MAEPKKNTAYEFYLCLNDTEVQGAFKVNPTIVAGDFQVSIDGGAFANLATLPAVTPSGSASVKVNLSAAEMNGDKIVVKAIDAANDEWDDVSTFIDAPVSTNEDIPSGVWAQVLEAPYTAQELMRVFVASLAGRVIGAPFGPITMRDTANTKDVIRADVDRYGNRSTVTLDP